MLDGAMYIAQMISILDNAGIARGQETAVLIHVSYRLWRLTNGNPETLYTRPLRYSLTDISRLPIHSRAQRICM